MDLYLPISHHMKMSESMAQLYNLFEKLESATEARELLTAIVANSIADIQEAGLPVTAAELEKRINTHINDFLEVAKKTNVA